MPELYPEDQAKVDRFLSAGVNRVERKTFKPLLLLLILFVALAALSAIALIVAKGHGVV